MSIDALSQTKRVTCDQFEPTAPAAVDTRTVTVALSALEQQSNPVASALEDARDSFFSATSAPGLIELSEDDSSDSQSVKSSHDLAPASAVPVSSNNDMVELYVPHDSPILEENLNLDRQPAANELVQARLIRDKFYAELTQRTRLPEISKHIKSRKQDKVVTPYKEKTQEDLLSFRRHQRAQAVARMAVKSLLLPVTLVAHPFHEANKHRRKGKPGKANTSFNRHLDAVKRDRDNIVPQKRAILINHLNRILQNKDVDGRAADKFTKIWRMLGLDFGVKKIKKAEKSRKKSKAEIKNEKAEENRQAEMMNFIKSFIVTELNETNKSRQKEGKSPLLLEDIYKGQGRRSAKLSPLEAFADTIKNGVRNLCDAEDALHMNRQKLEISSIFRIIGSAFEQWITIDGLRLSRKHLEAIEAKLKSEADGDIRRPEKTFKNQYDAYFYAMRPIEDHLKDRHIRVRP